MAANGNRYLSTKSLVIDSGGKPDLNDNDLVVNYTGGSPYSSLLQNVIIGLNGVSGITSGLRDSTGAPTFLALVDNSTVGLSEWPLGSGNTIDATTVIGKYTYFGDVNLDGVVNSSDYGIVDANFNTVPPASTALIRGDANLDGLVNSSDYGIIDANFNRGLGNPLSPAGQATPEPLELGAIVTLLSLSTRRRR